MYTESKSTNSSNPPVEWLGVGRKFRRSIDEVVFCRWSGEAVVAVTGAVRLDLQLTFPRFGFVEVLGAPRA